MPQLTLTELFRTVDENNVSRRLVKRARAETAVVTRASARRRQDYYAPFSRTSRSSDTDIAAWQHVRTAEVSTGSSDCIESIAVDQLDEYAVVGGKRCLDLHSLESVSTTAVLHNASNVSEPLLSLPFTAISNSHTEQRNASGFACWKFEMGGIRLGFGGARCPYADLVDLEVVDEDHYSPAARVSFTTARNTTSTSSSLTAGANTKPYPTNMCAFGPHKFAYSLTDGTSAVVDFRASNCVLRTRVASKTFAFGASSTPNGIPEMKFNSECTCVSTVLDTYLIQGRKSGVIELWDLRCLQKPIDSLECSRDVHEMAVVSPVQQSRTGCTSLWVNDTVGNIGNLLVGSLGFEQCFSHASLDLNRNEGATLVGASRLCVLPQKDAVVYPHIENNMFVFLSRYHEPLTQPTCPDADTSESRKPQTRRRTDTSDFVSADKLLAELTHSETDADAQFRVQYTSVGTTTNISCTAPCGRNGTILSGSADGRLLISTPLFK